MGEYTNSLSYINWEFDEYKTTREYVEKLNEVALKFRTFDDAITSFILDHGFKGDENNIDEKIDYISSRFKSAGIGVPRNIKKWFMENQNIKKCPTGYQFCFSFGLNVEETNEFFQKICLERGIDCHVIEEAVYYYSIKNKLNYSDAKKLIDRLSIKKPADKSGIIPYTTTIIADIDRVRTEDEFVDYIEKNRWAFAQNNVKATENVKKMWEDIVSENGLANKEKEIDGNNIEKKKRSTWETYMQILGLDNSANSDFDSNRSIKSILRNNPIICKATENCFPDRQGIDRIMEGKEVSSEKIRKIIILLSFYRFWINQAYRLWKKRDESKSSSDDPNDPFYAENEDFEKCKDWVNNMLIESGYQDLYYGNPYDWIFLRCMSAEYPLFFFREFMQTVEQASYERTTLTNPKA